MPLQIGIVGLPNVGKSTLFNALTKSRKANVANYPFCTIDPNVGVVEVPDERLKKLAEIVKPAAVIPATVEFLDIAGLVKGASKGEGLGNKFLANIRECHAMAQVVRVFQDSNVVHVHGDVNPKRDIEIIHAELLLADLETLGKRLSKAQSEAKSGDPKAAAYAELLAKLKTHLEEGKLAYDFSHRPSRSEAKQQAHAKHVLSNNICEANTLPPSPDWATFSKETRESLQDLHLLTGKPFLYIANVHESEIAKWTSRPSHSEAKPLMPRRDVGATFEALHKELGLPQEAEIVPISAKIEEELGQMSDEESKVFLDDLGLKESGLFTLIHAAYRTLGYLTFFTAGPKEVRAWTTVKGAKAPQAAGVIHTDFEKGFIAAEVISYKDFVECGNEHAAKEKGKMRVEGRDYVMQDGDICHFRFNV